VRLRYALPGATVNDIAYVLMADIVRLSKCPKGGVAVGILFANGPDIISREFGVFVTFAVPDAALIITIVHIVLRRSQKKMFRTNAKRSVTGMADVLAFWNRAISQFVGSAMGIDLFGSKAESPISIPTVDRAGPEPAGFGFANQRPEVFIQVFFAGMPETGVAAIFGLTPFNPMRFCGKGFSALLAGSSARAGGATKSVKASFTAKLASAFIYAVLVRFKEFITVLTRSGDHSDLVRKNYTCIVAGKGGFV